MPNLNLSEHQIRQIAQIVQKELEETLQITFNYPQLPAIMGLIKTTNAKVILQDFQLDCNLEICIPLEQSEKLKVLLQEIENTEIHSKGIY